MKRTMMMVLAALLFGAARGEAQSFAVVVNEANPVASLSADEVSKMFLKKTRSWPGGGAVAPVELNRASPVREAFSQAVHGRGAAAIESHWQQQIFAGKDVPPAEKPNDAEVIAFVKSNPNAIGYVSSGAATSGVKVVSLK